MQFDIIYDITILLLISLCVLFVAGLIRSLVNIALLMFSRLIYMGVVQDLLCRLMMKGAYGGRYPAEVIRSNFNDLNLVDMTVASNHTHGESAADRSGASSFMDRLALLLGLDAYFIQRSRADERNNREGSRVYYWVKDLTAQPSSYRTSVGDRLACIVDVDQYLDMPQFLSDNFQPTILYTFQPEQVARVAKEYSYTFGADDKVTYHVTGGATYNHRVWNYSTDSLITHSSLFGIPWYTSTYLIDRRRTSDDHELIMITPLYQFTFIFSWLARYCLSGKLLTPLSLHRKGFLRLETHSQKGVFTSTGRPGCFFQATIPTTVDDTLAAIARTTKFDLTMPQVLSHVDGDREKGAALLEYHRSEVDEKPDIIFPVPNSVRRYQFEPVSYDPNAKPSMTPFMSPFLNECFAPDQTLGNERQCVRGRVEEIKNQPMRCTPFLTKVMVEFVELFIPKAHQLDPVDADYVQSRQNRPSQRRILEDASFFGTKINRVISMFIKKEAYANPNDPRPISTINGVDKELYSRYIYALAEYIKTQKWYAFGKVPKDVAHEISNICQFSDSVILSDFSRFDGRVSNIVRELERLIFMRAFRRQYHLELLNAHRSQYGMKAFGTLGTTYEQDFVRASGSPETAAMNSLVNKFVAYLAFRMTSCHGGFMEPKVAYSMPGMYGGDDGLTGNMDPSTYQRAAALIGQKLTVDVIKRGELGVTFLARKYGPNVWYGDCNSMCDIKRQLSKFHTTTNLPPNVTPSEKLIEKCRAFILTDMNTPIIGYYCMAVIRIFGVDLQQSATNHQNIWGAQFERKDQYPNDYCDWYIDVVHQDLPAIEFAKFQIWLNRVLTLHDSLANELLPCGLTSAQCRIMQPILLQATSPPSLPKRSVVCDGELYIAENDRPFEEIRLPTNPNEKQRQNRRKGKKPLRSGDKGR